MEKSTEKARQYARKVWRGGRREFQSGVKYSEIDFLAGYESRQAEIDDLKRELAEILSMRPLDGYHY